MLLDYKTEILYTNIVPKTGQQKKDFQNKKNHKKSQRRFIAKMVDENTATLLVIF